MVRLISEVKAEGTEQKISDGPKNDFRIKVDLEQTCFAGNGTMSQKRFDKLIMEANRPYTRRGW